MSITIKKDVWRIKDDSGVYHSTDLFSTMLPSDAQQLVSETRTALTNIEAEANELLEDLGDAKQELVTEGTAQKNSITSFGDSKKQEIANAGAAQIGAIGVKGQEVLASIPSDYTELTKTVESIARGSIICDTASGSIASFDDGVDDMLIKSLVVNINPMQDLHGYDAPWPAGCEVNKTPLPSLQGYWAGADGTFVSNSKWIATEKIAVKASTTYVLASSYTSRSIAIAQYRIDGSYISSLAASHTNNYTFTTSEDCVLIGISIAGGASGAIDITPSAITDLRLTIGSSDVPYKPYKNSCEIVGCAGTTVSHSGADTSNPESLTIAWPDYVGTLETFLSGDATDTYRGITIEKQYNELIIDGTATGNARFKVSNTMAHAVSIQDTWLSESIGISNGLKKVIIEIVSGEVTSGTMYCALYKTNGETTFTNVIDTTTTEPRNIITFEKSDNDAACVVVYCPANTSVNNLHLRFIMVDPCVYGGSIDVISGELLITLAGKHFSDLTWTKNANLTYGFNGAGFTDRKKRVLSYNNPDCLCDTYPFYNASDPNGLNTNTSYGIGLSNSNNVINTYVVDARYSTVEEFTASFATHDPFFVAPLEEPIRVQLTPQEVECFLGVNNIWADTGDVTVTYPVDTKTYIDKKIQEAINGVSGS